MSLHLTLPRALAAKAAAVISTLAATVAPASSFAQGDRSYALYQCAVLGETRACPVHSPSQRPHLEVRTVPGPYATYLVHLGQDSTQAIESARAFGERPILRTTRITRRELSSFERYERVNGRLTEPDELREVLSEVVIDYPTQRSGRRPAGSSSGGG